MERYVPLFENTETDDRVPLEEISKRKVIRGGKVRRIFPSKPGYKIIRTGPSSARYVKISSSEHNKLSRLHKKIARKLRSKRRQIAFKRKRSMKKHTW